MRPARVALLTTLLLTAAAEAGAQMREPPLAEGRRARTIQGERYGTLTPDDPAVQRARGIFERIVRAAGRRPGLVLELDVLDTPRVIGQALPGGLVVVSRGLLDLAEGDDNALAFVLGHELAHVVRDHHAVLLARFPASSEVPAEQLSAYRDKELEADRLGVLFAVLAGYEPAAAVPMLKKVATDVRADPLHPAPRARAEAVNRQLLDISTQLEVLYLGLFLLGMDEPLDAARVLEQFAAVFPAREALSLGGLAWHKEALHVYTPDVRYRHLLVLDASTRALRLRGSPPAGGYSSPPPDPAFRRAMDRAVTLYKQAVEADPGYAPALNNLATAYLDLDERDLAAVYVNRALKADPALAAAYNNRGVLHALAGDPRKAQDDWLRALQLDPGRWEIIENVARVQKNPDDARAWRAKVTPLDRATYPAQALDGVVCGVPLDGLRSRFGDARVRAVPVPLGGVPGDDLALSIAPGQGLLVAVRRGVVEAVAAFGSARPVTREGVGPGDTAARVERAYGRPAGLSGVQAVNVWYYPARGMTIFIVGDRVQSVWAGRPKK